MREVSNPEATAAVKSAEGPAFQVCAGLVKGEGATVRVLVRVHDHDWIPCAASPTPQLSHFAAS